MSSQVEQINHLLGRQKIVQAEARQVEARIENYTRPSIIDHIHMEELFGIEEVFFELEVQIKRMFGETFSEQFVKKFFSAYFYPDKRVEILDEVFVS